MSTERYRTGRKERASEISFSKAWKALPDRDTPGYEIEGGVVEHLANFKGHIKRVLEKEKQGVKMGIGGRWVPLGVKDVKEMEGSSFRRDLSQVVTVDWEYLPEENPWAYLYEYGRENYRWWQISKLKPQPEGSEYTLYCIETSPQFGWEEDERFNLRSDFDIFFLKKAELEVLMESLTRNE